MKALVAIGLIAFSGVHGGGVEPIPAEGHVSTLDVVASYLGTRWAVTKESPTVVLCASLGRTVQDSLSQTLPGVVKRVSSSILVHHCDSTTTPSDFSTQGPVVMIQHIGSDHDVQETWMLRAVGDSRVGYRVLETFRFHGRSGEAISLTFSGFEEYHP